MGDCGKWRLLAKHAGWRGAGSLVKPEGGVGDDGKRRLLTKHAGCPSEPPLGSCLDPAGCPPQTAKLQPRQHQG